jgi:hypothetical protein
VREKRETVERASMILSSWFVASGPARAGNLF